VPSFSIPAKEVPLRVIERASLGFITYEEDGRELYLVARSVNEPGVLLRARAKPGFLPHFWFWGSREPPCRGDRLVINGSRYGICTYGDRVAYDDASRKLWRLDTWSPRLVRKVRSLLRRAGYYTFEADVPYVRRFLIDHGKKLSIPLDRVAWFDVEAEQLPGASMEKRNWEKFRVISIAVVDARGNEHVFRRYLVLVGYNSEEFDVPLLRYRLRRHGLPDIFQYTHHIDLFKWAKAEFEKHGKMDLDYVAHMVTGAHKVGVSKESLVTGRLPLHELRLYNHVDAILTREVDLSVGFTAGNLALMEISYHYTPDPDRLSANSLWDGLLLRRGVEYGFALPTKDEPYGPRASVIRAEDKRLEGGYVKDPVPGLHEWVVNIDFSGTYPSIIINHRVNPGFDQRFAHVFSEIEEFLVSERKKYKKLKKQATNPVDRARYDTMQWAYKVIANAGYGILGYAPLCGREDVGHPNCPDVSSVEKRVRSWGRVFDLGAANYITATARKAIQEVDAFLEERGYRVIYGDTDSAFVLLPGVRGLDDALSLAERILELANNVAQKYRLEFKIEYIARRIYFPGVKKRYAAWKVWEDAPRDEIIVKGIDIVRSDAPELFKEIGREFFDLVLRQGLDPAWAKKFLESKYTGLLYRAEPMKLARSGRIRKPLDQYKTSSPHVQAAKKLQQLGYRVRVGDRVWYVKGRRGGWEPVLPGHYEPSDIDYSYYVSWLRRYLKRL